MNLHVKSWTFLVVTTWIFLKLRKDQTVEMKLFGLKDVLLTRWWSAAMGGMVCRPSGQISWDCLGLGECFLGIFGKISFEAGEKKPVNSCNRRFNFTTNKISWAHLQTSRFFNFQKQRNLWLWWFSWHRMFSLGSEPLEHHSTISGRMREFYHEDSIKSDGVHGMGLHPPNFKS